jgi:hypothetical protein
MLTGKLLMSSRAPKPSCCISMQGSMLRMARCTTATACQRGGMRTAEGRARGGGAALMGGTNARLGAGAPGPARGAPAPTAACPCAAPSPGPHLERLRLAEEPAERGLAVTGHALPEAVRVRRGVERRHLEARGRWGQGGMGRGASNAQRRCARVVQRRCPPPSSVPQAHPLHGRARDEGRRDAGLRQAARRQLAQHVGDEGLRLGHLDGVQLDAVRAVHAVRQRRVQQRPGAQGGERGSGGRAVRRGF